MLRLVRIDASQNLHRFYRLEVWPTLFGEWTLRREWGRIGGSSRVLFTTCPSEEQVQALAQAKAREKQRRGYIPAPGSAACLEGAVTISSTSLHSAAAKA
jgi:predicted DNA-binding WGR domain protein